MQNDKILVQQTLAGDEQSFHRLIVSYQADIYALIRSWVKDPDDAKELVQDVFLEAYRDLASLRQPESFYFWLRQIARHRCQDWRKRKRQFIPLSENIVAETPSIDETLILRETLAKVMQAIDELPEKEKDILKERYLDDLSYAELQAKHGLSYKALSMRLLRAKQKVRARVEKLLAGAGVFSWHDALKKMLSGGVEAVKISFKMKVAIIGLAVLLTLGTAGVVVWKINNDKSVSIQNQTESITQQATQKSDVATTETKTSDQYATSKLPRDEMEEFITFLDEIGGTSEMGKAKGQEKNIDKNSASKKEEISPELRLKAERYSELAQILPTVRKLQKNFEQLQEKENYYKDFQMSESERQKIFDEIGSEKLNIVASIKTHFIQIGNMFSDLEVYKEREGGFSFYSGPLYEYFGRELPWDGNTDFFAAKTWKQGDPMQSR